MLNDKTKNLSDTPGIYLFYNQKKELIYVGKATSLKSRVKSYFRFQNADFRMQNANRPIEQMIHEVMDIKIIQTDSVLEAIILEANTIKKFQPKYNVMLKDDKSWNYIVITKDKYPRVITVRGHELNVLNVKSVKNDVNDEKSLQLQHLKHLQQFQQVFGPYPGLKTKEIMKLLRKLFYISTCQSHVETRSFASLRKKPCFYYQLGQCLGVCTGEINPTDYKKKVIKPLIQFLSGKKKSLLKNLEREMKLTAKQHEFEEAGRLRDQIRHLERIQDIALLNKNFVANTPQPPSRGDTFIPSLGRVRVGLAQNRQFRIEGYDISNLGSTGMVGSMVVFENSEPNKSEYRKFKIKTVKGQSDVDCLEEVLRRRMKHLSISNIQYPVLDKFQNADFRMQNASDKWLNPDVILVDGGLPQVNVVLKMLKEFGYNIPVVGIAKGPKRKNNLFITRSDEMTPPGRGNFVKWVKDNQSLLIQVRDEAHRFAIKYQRSLRKIK